ncbi:MAG: hypothetical protein AAF353_17940, partial [Pseudomonadota bacterium]
MLDGRSRIVWALGIKDPVPLQLKLTAGTVGSGADLTFTPEKGVLAADPFALTSGLSQNACAVLVTTILNTWSGLFRLSRSRSFLGFAKKLLHSVNDTPPVADCVAGVGETRIVETHLNSECSDVSSAGLIGDDGIRRLEAEPFNAPYNGGKNRLFVGTVSVASAPSKSFLVLSGPWGLAIRRIEAGGEPRSLSTWWAANTRKLPELRDHLITRFGGK